MSERGSLVWSIAAPILAAVMASVLLGGLALGWSLTRTIENSLRGEIALDIASIRQNEERLKIVAIADAIDHRVAAAPATSGGLYVLTDRDGAAITGNVSEIPTGVNDNDWIRFTYEAAPGRTTHWLGRKEPLPLGYTLFVARRSDGHWETIRQAAPAMTAILLLCIAFIAFVLSRTSRKIATTISDLNTVIDAARSGAPERRLLTTGQPRELMRLGQRVNALLDTIERQLANMRRLSTQAAHELRTPLARVVTRLRQAPESPAIAQSREDLEETLAVLQALLDIAEHESEPGVAAQPLDLASICSSVCDIYKDAAEDRGVVLHRSLSAAMVRGEPTLISRAVANLLDNALKASPNGGAVTVSTGVSKRAAFFSVADEGEGVSGRSVEDLVDAARSEPRAPNSHGLGLRFTRAIALRHGALLTVAPGMPRGSVFTLAFPIIV